MGDVYQITLRKWTKMKYMYASKRQMALYDYICERVRTKIEITFLRDINEQPKSKQI
jgi:hypothetical protein